MDKEEGKIKRKDKITISIFASYGILFLIAMFVTMILSNCEIISNNIMCIILMIFPMIAGIHACIEGLILVWKKDKQK